MVLEQPDEMYQIHPDNEHVFPVYWFSLTLSFDVLEFVG